jgi:hypothetical protein
VASCLMKKAFVNLSTARFRGNSHEAKKKSTFYSAVALGWCSASAATPSPRAVAVGNLRVCLVRVAVEPGSNLRAWLT